MSNIVKQILIFSLVVVAIAFVSAQKSHPFDEYIIWLTENSEFEYNGEAYPSITYYSSQDLQTLAYGVDRIKEAESEGRSIPKIKALYDHRNNRLLFLKGMDIRADETAYIVVHELVHFLQNINGITEQTECLPSLEKRAYTLQAKWQEAHNHSGPYPNFLFVSLLASGCNR